MGKEPLVFIQLGGMALVYAVLQLFPAFNHPLTAAQVTGVTGLAQVVLTVLARMTVTPIAQLPPGVADQIANSKAAKAAEKAGT